MNHEACRQLTKKHSKTIAQVSGPLPSQEPIPDFPASSKDLDTDFWMSTTGNDLSILLEEAGYHREARNSSLNVLKTHIAPFLGPRPTQAGAPHNWRSFMTDDYSPLEYSWAWERTPKIRYSYEPIGSEAGSSSDLFNRKRSLENMDSLRSGVLRYADWTWFNAFADVFYSSSAPSATSACSTPNDRATSSPSSIFMALEISAEQTAGKAYLVPVKAEQTGRSRLSVLGEAIQTIETPSLTLSAYPAVETYMNHREEAGSPLHIIGVAVDCVDPSLSKLKIYLRAQETSFESVRSVLSLGGAIEPWSDETLADLRELWRHVFSLDNDFSDSMDLRSLTHETAGILYNFDIKANNTVPDTKVYIPVKHYGRNDKAVAEGVVAFMRKKCYPREHTDAFLRATNRLCGKHRQLADGTGMQTYVSCAVKKGRLSVTSYISPQVYHPRRFL